MAKVYEFIADGGEEIEALTTVDVLRRGEVDIETVSIMGRKEVTMAHGVTIVCDKTFEEVDLSDADMLLLPGGLPGATNLLEHEGVREALLQQNAKGKMIGAICAAPMVLGDLGLLKGKKATCYPGFEKYLTGATYTHEICTKDGNIITGEGPAATLPYAYEILRQFRDDATVEGLREGMMFKHLMS